MKMAKLPPLYCFFEVIEEFFWEILFIQPKFESLRRPLYSKFARCLVQGRR
jgi:hypothetical protein